MTEKNYLITRMNGRIFSFLLHGQQAVEIHCDEEQADYALGNIYIGKIRNIAKNIGAAFVEIAPGAVCHLSLNDIRHPVFTKKGSSRLPQAGDELVVQISRESIKGKHPSVTTEFTLHGKYVLLMSGESSVRASSKLGREEKQRLTQLADGFPAAQDSGAAQAAPAGSTQPDFGWLFRTNAGGAEESLLYGEMELLYARYRQIMEQARHRTCFSCLLRTAAPYLLRLSDLYDSEADRILTDDGELFSEIGGYLAQHQPQDRAKLSLYQDGLLPMKKLYSLETQLARALQERVWLNSGGYLVIQPTEALTVIDVNTGKYEGGKKQESTFLKINREAAVEIARQLRLRNLSGIIIVDFINMKSPESNQELLALLEAELRKDPIRTVLVEMTSLSLVEITRRKKERPLQECVQGRPSDGRTSA